MMKRGATLKEKSKQTRSHKMQSWQNSWEKTAQENKNAHKESI